MAEPLRFPAAPIGGPVRRTPLGPVAERLTEVPAGLSLTVPAFPGQISLRGNASDPAFMAAVASVLGVAPSTEPCRVAFGESAEILWLSPDEWLVVVPGGREEVVTRTLRTALSGQVAAVVDVTDGRFLLHLSGPLASIVLAKECPLDLDRRAFKSGDCARTLFGSIPIIVQSVSDNDQTLRVFVAASLARFLVDSLIDQSLEF